MVSAQRYEDILNWFYDRSLEGRIELKATCAPHYFRIVRQRRAEARRAGQEVPEMAGTGRAARWTCRWTWPRSPPT